MRLPTAQVIALRQQIESLRVSIEWQIRSAMLDVQSSNELVKVARSNVDLATAGGAGRERSIQSWGG